MSTATPETYTPGPWKITQGLTEYSASITIKAAEENIWIASVNGDHHRPGERPQAGFPGNIEAKANAQLIVLAPEILEALIEAVQACKSASMLPTVYEKWEKIIFMAKGGEENAAYR